MSIVNSAGDAEEVRDSAGFTKADQTPAIRKRPAVPGGIDRELGAFEELFWLVDQTQPYHFAVTAQLEGKTSLAAWRAALDLVQRRHPMLSVCIEAGGLVPWFRRVSAPITLRVVDGDEAVDWQAEACEELITPFNPSIGPLARAVLVQGAHGTSLILAAHHAIADAKSIAYVIRDILRAIAGVSLGTLPMPASEEQLLGISHLRPSRTGGDDDGSEGADRHRYNAPLTRKQNLRTLRFSPDLTLRLRNRAREENTTVHGALVAALAIAGQQLIPAWQGSPARILSPIDIRTMLGVGEACGVFVSAFTGAFFGESAHFWDLARLVKTGLHAAIQRPGVAAVLTEVQRTIGRGMTVAQVAELVGQIFAREGFVTNLGSLPFEHRFGPLKLKSIWGPVVTTKFEHEEGIGVATAAGALCLTHMSPSSADELLPTMQTTLEAACAS